MAGQNRSSYARSSPGANRGLAAFFRGVFILILALMASFALGFFVIARMVPPSVTDTAGNNGAGANRGSAGQPASNHRTQHTNSPTSSSQLAAKPEHAGSTAQAGPEILPDDAVQQPNKLESDAPNTASGTSTDTNTADTSAHHGARSDNGAVEGTGVAPTAGADNSNSDTPRRSRRNRAPGADSGAVQPASSPDASGAANDSSRAAATDAAPPVKTGVYRVQIGVYSTREKAEEIARSAADKGIATTLHIINRDGRTLYRVQQSMHHDRAKAELDRQKLIDAGFDATIINPS